MKSASSLSVPPFLRLSFLLPSLAYASLRPSIHPLRHFIFLHSTKFRLPQNRVRIERGNQPRRRAIRPTMLYMLPSLSSPLLSLSIHPRFGRLMRAGCSDNISPPPPPLPRPPRRRLPSHRPSSAAARRAAAGRGRGRARWGSAAAAAAHSRPER